MVKVEKNGTVVAGADCYKVEEQHLRQTSIDLLPDPANLRDLAARFRDDAAMALDENTKSRLYASAEDAESKAEAAEASALWTTPLGR